MGITTTIPITTIRIKFAFWVHVRMSTKQQENAKRTWDQKMDIPDHTLSMRTPVITWKVSSWYEKTVLLIQVWLGQTKLSASSSFCFQFHSHFLGHSFTIFEWVSEFDDVYICIFIFMDIFVWFISTWRHHYFDSLILSFHPFFVELGMKINLDSGSLIV